MALTTSPSTTPNFTSGVSTPMPVSSPSIDGDGANPNASPATTATVSPAVVTSNAAQNDYSNIRSNYDGIVSGMQTHAANVANQQASSDAQAKADEQAKQQSEIAQKTADTAATAANAKMAAVSGTPSTDQFASLVGKTGYLNGVKDTGNAITEVNKNADGTYTIATTKHPNQFVVSAADLSKFSYSDQQIAEDQKAQNKIKDDQTLAQYNAQLDGIVNGSVPLTDAQNAQINGLKQQFQQLINQQVLTNAGATGIANVRGYQTGAGEYDPSFQAKTIGSIITAGQNKIADLNIKMAAAVAEMTEGFKDKNYNRVKDSYNRFIEERDKRTAALNETIDKAQKQVKEAQDAKKAADRDTAITELYSSGVTNPADILAKLNKQGIVTSAKEIGDTLKNTGVEDINKIASEAAKNGAPLSVVAKIGQAKTVAEANMLAAGHLQDPLDTAYRKAQISKIYADIQKDGVDKALGTDPQALVSYAQQYASTGQIPAGIPKGSFGVIAQIAKEAPKQPGQIVSTATGIKPQGETAYSDALANLASAIELAKQLKELDKSRIGGVVSGTAGKVFGSENQQKYVDLRTQIIDLLSRARSGAALTPHEEATYGGMLPGRFSEPFGLGVNSDVKIDNFINNLTSDLTNKAASKGWSVYGMSKVKLGGSDYTVGDIIKSPDGRSGRVNPDGSITIVQ